MRNILLLLLNLKVFGRILKSNRRGKNNQSDLRGRNIITNSDTIHEDPHHVDFDYRRKRHGHGHRDRGEHHTGTLIHVKKRGSHGHHRKHGGRFSTVEEAVKDDIKKSTGISREEDLPISTKTLAREAGRGNTDAVKQLQNDGVLTEPFASDLIDAQEKSPLTGLTQDQVEQILANTPHTSAPMKYSSMKEVKPGVNPALDKTLKAQNFMKWLRSFLPKVNKTSDKILDKANDILSQAPDGDITAPFTDPNGNATGKTYGEEAQSFVQNAVPAVERAIDQLMAAGLTRAEAEEKIATNEPFTPDCELNGTCHPLTKVYDNIEQSLLNSIAPPHLRATNEFEFLVKNGVNPENAAQLAQGVEQSAQNEIQHRMDLADAMKENAKVGFEAANHKALQKEIEDEKNAEKAKMIETMNNEVRKQHTFPWFHPIHLNEEELGYLRQLGNQLTPQDIGRRMYEAFSKAAETGGTHEDALDSAARTGYLLSNFNNELRKGTPPAVATDIINERAKIKDAVEQRRSFVQNNGPEIAHLVAENTKLIQKAAANIANNPETKDDVMQELDNSMKILADKHATTIHEQANSENINKPRKAAADLIDETQIINNKILHIAKKAPIVAKDIMKKGMDNARHTAEVFNNTLEYVNTEEKRHSPIPKSALRLLNEAKKEEQLDQIAKKNAETEKQHREVLLKEHQDADVMATEERLAKNNRARKISEAGIKAAQSVLKTGGTIEEARAAKAAAEKAILQEIESREAQIRQDVMRSLNSGVDSKKAAQIAAHVATAHSGDNAIGKTSEEVLKNELEERKKEALEKALYSDFSNEKMDVLKVIPNDASEININNSVIKFPLKTFVDEKPKDKGEEFVKNRSDVLKNLVRNTVTRNNVNSGLNTIQTNDGFLNAGENSTKLQIQDAVAYIEPSGKLQMESEGIDTSHWKSKHNQGERPDIPNGELYYETEIKDADLILPSPTNKTPSKFLSNANEQLDTNYIDELHIKKGTLHQTPWNEFSDTVKPRLNLYPNEEEKIREANIFKNALAEEKKKEKLDSIRIFSFTNPNGDKHITTVPQYGITETFEENEGMKRLSNIDPDKNIAISETPTESQKEPMINSLENVSEDQIMNTYIENTIAEGRTKNKAGRFVSPTNGFTNEEDTKKAELLQVERFDITKHFIRDGSEASRVKNDLISKTFAYSKALGMEKEDYINLIKRIPDSVIYKMNEYNSDPNKKPTEILDTDFSKSLKQVSSNDISTSNLINYIFNSISKVTGKPNNTSAVILEKHIVPNLKAVENTNTLRVPNRTTQIQTIEPPKPGSTVINEIVTNGPPNIATGPNSSYQYPNPIGPPIRFVDNQVRNPGPNPLTSGQVPFNQTTRASFNTNNPAGNAFGSPSPGINLPNQPRPAGAGANAPNTPQRRLGIASSPQR